MWILNLVLRLAWFFICCRGEKAFCSLTCRAMEIMIDEELEKSNTNPPCENSEKPKLGGELLFEAGILTAS